ncbi:MAG: aromatic ring-hydroxylating dioxygenase subunit alpha [Acidisphaera sp.]|nr:aromatic ring-hydroxylating dioxygenase subunit alpha [Acidisphaera sp.]
MASTESEVLQMLRSRRKNFSLPGPFYSDPAIYALDMQAIFYREWQFVGITCEIPNPGDYMTVSIGDTPIVVVRGQDGAIRGFFNSCRHRGFKVCDATHGSAKSLVCPYHRWTYRLNGELAWAGRMPEDFDRSPYGLRPLHVRTAGGTIYVSLADDPPDFTQYGRELERHMAPHDLDNAKVAFEVDLTEYGNWKLVVENSRECYHCATEHRDLMRTFRDQYNFDDPESLAELRAFHGRCEAAGLTTDSSEGPNYRTARMPFTEGSISITLDGKPAVSRLLGNVPHGDIGSLRWFHFPSVFNHVMGDYAVMIRMLPVNPQETLVTTKFLVNRDAVEGSDYDLKNLIHVWNITNDEDKGLVERNQAGVNSIGYVPGPYSTVAEGAVIKFVEWYCDEMERHLGGQALRVAAE